MNRKRDPLRKGDVFCVVLDEHTKQYFQYIIVDDTQLGSHVIKVFTEKYPINAQPVMADVIECPVSFYVHVILQFGILGNYWAKVGRAPVVDDFSVWFKSSYDYGDGGKTKVSKNWRVWQINQENNDIGELLPQYYDAELGLVINPESIIVRMRTGQYDLNYPAYL